SVPEATLPSGSTATEFTCERTPLIVQIRLLRASQTYKHFLPPIATRPSANAAKAQTFSTSSRDQDLSVPGSQTSTPSCDPDEPPASSGNATRPSVNPTIS